MGSLASAALWMVVPALVAAGLMGLGVWAIRSSRGDVSRAVGILVVAVGVVVIGAALLTIPSVTVSEETTIEWVPTR